MRLASLALLPLHAVQLATGGKSFVDNPLIGSNRLNRWGLHTARVRLADRLARWRRRRLAGAVPAAARAAFDRDGFVVIEDFLPPETFAALRERALTTPAPTREMTQGATITRRQSLEAPPYRGDPAVARLLGDPRWTALLRYVGSFASRPLFYVQTILTHRDGGDADPQTALHADTFHATVKAWLYLTDVAIEDGPLCYVPGSHRVTPQRLAWERARSLSYAQAGRLSQRGSPRIAVDELPALDLPPPRALPVRANTLIVADTFGFHARVAAARASTRIEVWAYGRRNPFWPWTGLDPLSLPGIAPRRVEWLWAAQDRLARWFGQPWRDLGLRRAGDEL